jgi:hypothetical protein
MLALNDDGGIFRHSSEQVAEESPGKRFNIVQVFSLQERQQ